MHNPHVFKTIVGQSQFETILADAILSVRVFGGQMNGWNDTSERGGEGGEL